MKFPVETRPALLGAAGGALALAFVGFSWGGWVTGSTSERAAAERAQAAVVAALTPVCVGKFKANADADQHIAALKKVNTWEQSSYVEKGGWADMPGTTTANSALARACADAISNITK